MPAHRRATPSVAAASTKRSRMRPKKPVPFVWNVREWKLQRVIINNVEVLHKADCTQLCVVKKVLKHETDSSGASKGCHFEVHALHVLPECNRVVKMLAFSQGYPEPGYDTVIFEHFPLGDLRHWKKFTFDNKNYKPIPEAYIWRFFIQMSQAVAFIHNQIGPNRESRQCIIHRDIKPKNILVVNNGTTYPSFKLHDFGCGTVTDYTKCKKSSFCGTFDWQPPENPKINTPAADIWALGACVHYLAVGKAPIRCPHQFKREYLIRHGYVPPDVDDYTSVERFYTARTPREVTPINLTVSQQKARLMQPSPRYNPTYSDELQAWMEKALHKQASRRATTKQLLNRMVPEAKEMLKQLSGAPGLVDLEVCFGDADRSGELFDA